MSDQQQAVPVEETVILIEWPRGGRGDVEKASAKEQMERVSQQSERAINLAMGTIRSMAYRIARTIEGIEEKTRPDEAEIEFGLNLDAEAGAFLARASTGAQISVKLKWNIEQPRKAKVLLSEGQ